MFPRYPLAAGFVSLLAVVHPLNAQDRIAAISGLTASKVDTAIDVSVFPTEPFVERAGGGQRLNMDIVVRNRLTNPVRLARFELRALDADRRLLFSRWLERRAGSAIETIPWRQADPGERLVIFNPLWFFEEWRDLRHLEIAVVMYDPTTGEHYVGRAEVWPVEYRQRTDLILPVPGRITVVEGHGFYGQHRRQKQAASPNPDVIDNPVRFAYDIAPVDEAGRLYRGNPGRLDSWYAYGTPVVAPGPGVVISAANDVPENRLDGEDVYLRSPPESASGNHVIIDHGNGEYSSLVHLQPGSVLVSVGEHVEQGQALGRIGFSGDTNIPVHLHYDLSTRGAGEQERALPVYFRGFLRLVGADSLYVRSGTVDEGEIVVSVVSTER